MHLGIQEKHQRGKGWRTFQGLMKNKVVFPGVIREKNVKFPMVLVLGLGISRSVAQLCRISHSEASFHLEFPGVNSKVKSLEIPGVFLKKYIVNPSHPATPRFFFLEQLICTLFSFSDSEITIT